MSIYWHVWFQWFILSHMLSSQRVQRTVGELCRMVQRHEAHYKQNQWACGGLPWFKSGPRSKEATNSKVWMLHTNQPRSTQVSSLPCFSNSVSHWMLNMATIPPSAPEIWHWIMARKVFSQHHHVTVKLTFAFFDIKYHHSIILASETFVWNIIIRAWEHPKSLI